MKKVLVAMVLALLMTTAWVAVGSQQIGACDPGTNESPC